MEIISVKRMKEEFDSVEIKEFQNFKIKDSVCNYRYERHSKDNWWMVCEIEQDKNYITKIKVDKDILINSLERDFQGYIEKDKSYVPMYKDKIEILNLKSIVSLLSDILEEQEKMWEEIIKITKEYEKDFLFIEPLKELSELQVKKIGKVLDIVKGK